MIRKSRNRFTEKIMRLNGFCYDWLLRGCKRTFSRFHRGVVTTYALEVGAAGDGDNRDHSFSAFRAACCLIHEMILPIFPPLWLIGSMVARGPNSRFSFYRHLRGEVCFGSIQASV